MFVRCSSRCARRYLCLGLLVRTSPGSTVLGVQELDALENGACIEHVAKRRCYRTGLPLVRNSNILRVQCSIQKLCVAGATFRCNQVIGGALDRSVQSMIAANTRKLATAGTTE